MSFRRLLAAVAALSIVVAACGPSAPSSGSADPSLAPSAAEGVATPAADPTARPCPSAATGTTPDPTGWWADRVFYEVFVRSFADADGDGIGDLRGLISKLDYLNDGDPATTDDLGITALWLMPVAESPSYHGYDVSDYRTVEPDYGTNDDFKTLIAAARERGIEVIVDLVMNHTSIEHPWFQDARAPGSEHDDWYVWSDEHPGFGGPGGRPVWHADGGRWYYGYFWEGMPDLNVADAAVTFELDAIARFWVDEMGAAGFRLDAARHLLEDGSTLENTPATFAWLQGFRDRLQASTPSALVLGEVWDSSVIASRYVRDGALDLAFDFDLAAQMLLAVKSGDPGSLRFVQRDVLDAYPVGGYAAFLSNHDQDRVFDVVGRDVAVAKQAATLLLTNPGVPFLYYGEEVGLRGRKPDERIRTPMPWTAEGPGFGFTTAAEPWQPMADGVAEGSSVAVQAADPGSLLSHYRELIGVRAAHPALGTAGTWDPMEGPYPAVHAVLRHDPSTGEALVVISNLSDEPLADVKLELAEGPLCGAPGVVAVFGDAPGALGAPAIGATGGIDEWSIGDLAPRQDLILALTP